MKVKKFDLILNKKNFKKRNQTKISTRNGSDFYFKLSKKNYNKYAHATYINDLDQNLFKKNIHLKI